MNGYRDWPFWKEVTSLTADVRDVTLRELPEYDRHEMGARLRASALEIRCRVVEGFAWSTDREKFIDSLMAARAACAVGIDLVTALYETDSLPDETICQRLHDRLELIFDSLEFCIHTRENADEKIALSRNP